MHRREGKLIVSATDLVGFLACGHLTQLERAAAAGLVEKPIREDPEIELLQRRGYAHEQRYIEQLERDGRRVTELPENAADGSRLSYAARATATEEAMRRGDDVIFQATVFDGRWVGHPDFLLRVEGRPPTPVSRFDGSDPGVIHITDPQTAGDASAGLGRAGLGQAGPGRVGLGRDWQYEVADTKLAHSTRASALIQICSYVEQIERIQTVRPEHVHVVLGGAQIKVESFRTAEMMAYYRHAKARFEEALDEAVAGAPVYPIAREKSYPDPVEHCAVCRWSWSECKPAWRRDDALPLVAGISSAQREVLVEHEIPTRRGLSGLRLPLDLGLKRGQNDSMWRMREQARLQVASDGLEVPVFELLDPERDADDALLADRGLSALPSPSVGDLFFDIEGDPFAFNEGLEYLFGIWDGAEYRGFWALDRAAEKQAFEQVVDLFIGRLEQDPDMHIYHYAAYEPSALKRLAGRHATREEELDRLLRGRVFVDLYRVVRQGVRVGSERYSIKNLEPLYGYRREIELRDAGSSIVEFESYLDIWLKEGRRDQAVLDNIELYNRDDCVSTHQLRDWLEERRWQAASQFGEELPRPPAEVPETSEELSDRQRAVHELEQRLTAAIPKDPEAQTDADRTTWLVAHLIDWHRREDKSTFWRFFDLMSKSDEELIEEAEPIGGLLYVEMTELGGRSRSNVYRYTFPQQEHKIEAGNSLNDPQLFAAGGRTGTGSVEAIDDEARTIDIKRARAWTGPHPTSVVALDVIDAKAQREALMRLGEWVAEHGIDSSEPGWQAARDLLRRRRPRIRGGATDVLVGADEPGSEAARRLAPLLDGTTLAIQGPPGSGKTYTGARMILDLVRAGKKVGISSNGHKVICNLVEAVLDAAHKAGESVRVIQKGKEHEAVSDPAVRPVDDNSAVANALRATEVDIAAGTPWLWAREEMSGLVDTLFVDEAGQVSLANVVALSGAARNIVLLGDPQQLDQPTQGVHPDGAGRSALGHFLGDDETVPVDRGLFLERTYRMHPQITAYTSDLFYEGKLKAVEGLERQRVLGDDWLSGSGLRWVEVRHAGNTNASEEEARQVVEIVRALVGRGWIDSEGREWPIEPTDIRIVSPFNAHRLLIGRLLREAGLDETPVGTVDKFQGQQAPVSIYTMATSRPEDAPRGIDFLYSLNRLNVATSRARALAIVVCSPALLGVVAHTPNQLRMANGLCAFVEAATQGAT